MSIMKNNKFLKLAVFVLLIKVFLLGFFIVPAMIGNEVKAENGQNNEGNIKVPEQTTSIQPSESEKSLSIFNEKEKEIAKRYSELKEKEEKIKIADEEIKNRIIELKNLRSEIEGMLKIKEQKDEEKIQHLVKIYSSMKGEAAAQIMDKLPDEVITEMFSRMKGDQVAKILGLISKDKAVRITSSLTGMEP